MVKIVINAQAAAAVRGAALLPFKDTSRALPNGNREIEIDDDLFARLKIVQFEGESLSDVIIRAVYAYKGKPN